MRPKTTLSTQRAGPFKNENVHPHRQELLAPSTYEWEMGSFRRQAVPHQIGQHVPRPHGRKEMQTTSGGSVECAREPESTPGIEAKGGRRTFWHTPMENEEIMCYRHFRFQLPERSIHREWQYSCLTYPMELQPGLAHLCNSIGQTVDRRCLVVSGPTVRTRNLRTRVV